MHKTSLLVSAILLLVSAAPAQQEIFDLVRKGDLPAVKAFVEKSPDALGARLPNGSTPLHVAAANNLADIAAALLEKGSALEARDGYGRTPLILCARERGQAALGRVLIQAGADINAVDKFGDSALSLAAWRGKADFIDLLLEKGAKLPTAGPKVSALVHQSATQGLATLFRRLLEGGGDVKKAVASK